MLNPARSFKTLFPSAILGIIIVCVFFAISDIVAMHWQYQGLAAKALMAADHISVSDIKASERQADYLIIFLVALSAAAVIIFIFLRLRPLTAALEKEITARLTREKELTLFQKKLDSTNDGIFIISPSDGRFLNVNATANTMLGYSRAELLALRVTDVDVNIPDAVKWQEFTNLIAKQDLLFNTELRRQDASTFPVEINIKYIAPLPQRYDHDRMRSFANDDSRDYLIAAVRNTTERQENEALTDTKMRQLAALNSFALKVAEFPSFNEISKACLSSLVAITGIDFAILYLLRKDDLLPIDSYSRPPFSRQTDSKPHCVGHCLCGLAALGKPVYSNDIHTDPRCTMRECKDAGMQSFAALPLLKGKSVIGVLGLSSLKKRDFAEEADFLEALAAQTSLGAQNAQLYDELQQHANALDSQVKERTTELTNRNSELERLNKLFVDRELRMVELKERSKKLEQKLRDMGEKA